MPFSSRSSCGFSFAPTPRVTSALRETNRPKRGSLHPELPQMMIQMLVHQSVPLLRRERSKEGVRMLGAALRPALGETVNQCAQALAFLREVSFIRHNKTLGCRSIAPHRRFVLQHLRFHERANDPPDEHSRLIAVANGPLHRRSAVRHRLRRIHFAPLSYAVWPSRPTRSLTSFAVALSNRLLMSSTSSRTLHTPGRPDSCRPFFWRVALRRAGKTLDDPWGSVYPIALQARGGHRNTKSPVRRPRLLGLWKISSVVGVGGAKGLVWRLVGRRRQVMKLLGFGRTGERRCRSAAARDDILDFVEIAGTHETLVFCRGVLVLAFALELGFLQVRVG